MKRIFDKSRGQIAVLYAGIIVTLIGAIGLGADVAVMYVNWQELQKAADAAALAAADDLPYNSSQASTTAQTWAENNGALSTEITGTTVSANDLSVTVKLSRSVAYNFAKVLGMSTQTISVSATAGILANPSDTRGLTPFGLSWPHGYTGTGCNTTTPPFVVGQTYCLKSDKSNNPGCPGTSLPGNWGALALGGNGADQYRQNIQIGYNGTITCGDNAATDVATEPGNIVGPTNQGITDRMNAGVAADPGIPAGSAPASNAALSSYQYDPRLIVAPMVDFTVSPKGGKTEVPVVQFALMWLTGTPDGGATVTAVYLGTAPPQSGGGSTVATFGTLNPVLQN